MLHFWSHSKAHQQGNQHPFQEAVIASQASGKILPLLYFPNGQIYFEDMTQSDRHNVTLIHNNFLTGIHYKYETFTKNKNAQTR